MRWILFVCSLPLVLLCSACDSDRDRNASPRNSKANQEKFIDDEANDSSRKPSHSPFQLKEGENGRIERIESDGRKVWSTPLKHYVGGVRPPHLLDDGSRVYVSGSIGGVTALDARSGKIVWHADGPGERMCLHDRLLLATECGGSPTDVVNGRWVVARSTATGKDVFKVKLPPEIDDAMPIRRVAGCFLVQQVGFTRAGLLIDDKGQVRLRFDKYVVDAVNVGEDIVILTETNLYRTSLSKQLKWSIALKEGHGDGGRIRQLSSGDLVAYHYDPISDSGVGVLRIDPASGTVRWRLFCKPLGVSHSKYKHEAKVRIENGRLKVTSIGSGGRFDEILDLHAGKLIRRDAD